MSTIMYYQNNRDRILHQKREFYQKNRDRILKCGREYWHRRGRFLYEIRILQGKNFETLKCPICDKTFARLKYRRAIYCSRKCLGVAQKGKNNPFHGKVHSEKLRHKMRRDNPMYKIDRHRENNPFYGKHHTEEWKIKQRQRWQNKEFKERFIHNLLKKIRSRPTTPEKTFIRFCDKYNLPFNYVGDGSLIIDGKNPDFAENNGKKICIEIAGRYWHDEKYPNERINHFGKQGWKCIVIWEDELDDEPSLLGKMENLMC